MSRKTPEEMFELGCRLLGLASDTCPHECMVSLMEKAKAALANLDREEAEAVSLVCTSVLPDAERFDIRNAAAFVMMTMTNCQDDRVMQAAKAVAGIMLFRIMSEGEAQ